MNFWIEKTIVKNRNDRKQGDRALGKALWSPRKDKRGADIYKNMRYVNIGDVIIHFIDNECISGISLVSKKYEETIGVSGTDWERDAYLISLKDYVKLDIPIHRTQLLNTKNEKILFEISAKSEVFYDSKLNLRQGAYLTHCSEELAKLINDIYIKQTGKSLPHFEKVIFENCELPKSIIFNKNAFSECLENSGLIFKPQLITRFISSLITKPFVILTGLSGSGKTKLAQSFAQWICQDKEQYCIVPVGADWTSREPLLGYPNALDSEQYIKPDNCALDVLINAQKHPDLPYFLILDEMNLSHVERYFADFLSVMESNGDISLFSGEEEKSGVPAKLRLPKNLFIIGTVNIDETTYMFSPKVLDRANTIEFRVNQEEIAQYFEERKDVDLSKLETQGVSMAQSFVELAANKDFTNQDMENIHITLVAFFAELKKTGAEFGYRTAGEIIRLVNQLTVIDGSLIENKKLDIAIMQKLLPKLHGSRRKLCPVLQTLAGFCVDKSKFENIEKDILAKADFDFNGENIKYPLSLEKIVRMYNGAIDNGFASYAEA